MSVLRELLRPHYQLVCPGLGVVRLLLQGLCRRLELLVHGVCLKRLLLCSEGLGSAFVLKLSLVLQTPPVTGP